MTSEQTAHSGAPLSIAAQLRTTARAWVTGVAVLTTANAAGSPHGTTINSLTTISLDPPLLLISLASSSQALSHIVDTRLFALNVLAHDQEDLARRFATPGRGTGTASFTDLSLQPGQHTERLLLRRAISTFECQLHTAEALGDHHLVIGTVLSCDSPRATKPLVFSDGFFTTLERV